MDFYLFSFDCGKIVYLVTRLYCRLFVQVKTIREDDGLKEKSKGKTKEGATELLTMGDLQSHRKMFNLLKNTFPDITVSFCKIKSFLFFIVGTSA